MKVSVPDLGDFADVEIIEVYVKVGDRVVPEDPIVTLETDKATMDVPSPAAGVVTGVEVSVGDRVSMGDALIMLDSEEEPAAAEPAETADSAGRGASDAAAAAAGAERSEPSGPAPPGQGPRAPSAGVERAVEVPDLGDFADVDVIEVLVAEGDEVEAEQGLITLETEKATMDVPAPEAGTVAAIRVKVGDRVSAGDKIMTLRSRAASPEAGGGSAAAGAAGAAAEAEHRPAELEPEAGARARAAASAPAPRPETAPAPVRPQPAAIDEAGFSRVHASPSVRKLARELGVDLARVSGSGRKGRVTADDVKSFVKEAMRGAATGGALPAVPQVDFARFGSVELRPLSRIQRISGARLHASWVNIPHVTQHDEADITALEDTRGSLKEQARDKGIRLTPLAFILRACVLMLEEFPRFKASLSPDGESLIYKHYTHIGFAADTPNGLVVPVIRDADKKDVYELAGELGTLSERARAGRLTADDIQGAVFTISSLGGIGGTFFTPIVNAPEVAILGVSRSQWRPAYRGGEFVPRLMLPLSLSYDHRVIDGAEAVRFTTRLAETLGRVERLLEAVP